MKVKGLITISLNGEVVRKIKNTITNAGLAQVALLSGDAAAVPFTYLALGTGTTGAAAGDTTLETETSASGLARASAAVTQVTTTETDDTSQLLKAFTAGASVAVTECGILNASSAGTLLGRQVFAAVNVVSSDVLTITYQVAFA